MTDLDLTEAIEEAYIRLIADGVQRPEAERVVRSVAPLIERQVRERIAADTREAVEAYLYDGDHDRPLPGYHLMLGFADNIARGGGS